MKKGIIVLLTCFVSSISITYAQSNAFNSAFNQTNELPQESIFVHFNASLFLAGESMYYKVYCLDIDTKKISALSKIAYVELIGENQEVVFKHKITLDSGVGYSDFIIPIAVNSGNYKLIAYTQWMKNQGINSFFTSDISIINPFQSNQEAILVDEEQNQSNELSKLNLDNLSQVNSELLEIETNQKTFQKRSKVVLTLKNKGSKNLSGNYSISVTKVDALNRLASKTGSTIGYKYSKSQNTLNYLPELRGELLSGKLLNVSNNNPVSNEKVALSIQQNDFILKISKTNQEGDFYFNVSEGYDKETAVIQVLGKDNNEYKIILDKHTSLDYSDLDFDAFKISSDYKSDLEQRNIYNQIENGYFDLKPNKHVKLDTIQPFFENYFATYYLDDYTRFNKIQETFVEVISDAYIKRDKNNKLNFYVTSLDAYEQIEKPAGIIVDGILLQNFDELLEYDSRRVKRISIARTDSNFIFGTNIFGGLIVIETIDGKFSDELSRDYLNQVKLFKPQLKKAYFKKEYSNDNVISRIPDYRSQLFWEPNVNMENNLNTFTFFTSDNAGQYEISIEGYTANGNPVSIRDYIIVN